MTKNVLQLIILFTINLNVFLWCVCNQIEIGEKTKKGPHVNKEEHHPISGKSTVGVYGITNVRNDQNELNLQRKRNQWYPPDIKFLFLIVKFKILIYTESVKAIKQ